MIIFANKNLFLKNWTFKKFYSWNLRYHYPKSLYLNFGKKNKRENTWSYLTDFLRILVRSFLDYNVQIYWDEFNIFHIWNSWISFVYLNIILRRKEWLNAFQTSLLIYKYLYSKTLIKYQVSYQQRFMWVSLGWILMIAWHQLLLFKLF